MLLLIDLHLLPLILQLAFQLQHPEAGVGSGFAFFGGCVTSRNIRLRHLRSYDTSAPSTSPTFTTISHYTLSIIKVSLYSLVFFVFLCILKNNISYDTSAMTTICTNTLCYVPTQLSTIASATD